MMNEQLLIALSNDIAALPLESRWMLRGIQLGMKLSAEIDRYKREELIRCGLYSCSDPEASAACQGSGDHGADR